MNMKQFMAIFMVVLMLGTGLVLATEPAGSDNTITIDEDNSHTFVEADFSFSDSDGDSLSSVNIGTTVSVGSLDLSGTPVSSSDIISVADITAGNLVFTPVTDDEGTSYDTFTFTLTDDGAVSGTPETSITPNTITIDVTAINDDPVLTTIGDQNTNEDEVFSLSITSTDVDAGDVLTVIATTSSSSLDTDGDSNVDSTFFTDNGDGTADLAAWTPTNDEVGDHVVTMTVTDSTGATAVETFTITVDNVNDDPVLTSIGSQTGMDTVEFTLSVSSSDVDAGDSLTVSAVEDSFTSSSSSLDLSTDLVDNGDGTADLTWTPVTADVGDHVVTMTVTDSAGATAVETFTIEVLAFGSAPFLSISDQSATEDSSFTLAAFASDADSSLSSLSFSAVEDSFTSTSSSLDLSTDLVDNGDGSFTLTWTPVATDVGNHVITVTVTDDFALETEEVFTITVAEFNDAPTVTLVGDLSIDQDSSVSMTFLASDEEDSGSSLSFSLSDDSDSPSTTLDGSDSTIFTDNSDGTATLTWTPSSADVGAHDITITVTDSGGETAEEEFTITVNNLNDAPVLNTIGAQSATEDSEFVLTITYSDADVDVDSAESLTVTTTEDSFDSTSSSLDSDGDGNIADETGYDDDGDGTITLTWTPDSDDVGDHEVTVTVTDVAGEVATETFTLTVAESNDAPGISLSGSTASVSEDSVGTDIITATGSDEEDALTDLSFTVSEASFTGPSSSLDLTDASIFVDNSDGTATLDLTAWTPVNDDVGDHVVTITVTDSSGSSTSDTVTITVSNTNDAPEFASDAATDQNAFYGTDGSSITFSYQVTATDVDTAVDSSESLTYSVSATGAVTPTNAFSIDSTDGTVSWDATSAEDGIDFTVTVTTTDLAGLTADVSFDVTVAGDSLPTFAGLDFAGYTVAEDSALSGASFTVSDADGDAVTVSSAESSFTAVYSGSTSTFDTGAIITDDSAGSYTLSWTPVNDDVGVHVVTLTANDGKADSTESITITVSNVNDVPVVATIDSSDLTATEDVAYSLSITTSDADGDTVTIDYTSTSTKVDCDDCTSSSLDLTTDITDSDGDGIFTLSWTPDSDDVGDHDVDLVFTDSNGGSVTASFTIVVSEVLTTTEENFVNEVEKLEDDFADFENDFDDLYEDYEDAEEDDDDREIDDLEDDLDDLNDDLIDLDEEQDDLYSEIGDDDSISDDLQSDLRTRLNDLEDDITDLRGDIQDLLDDGTGVSSSSSTLSSTDGESATETTSTTSTTTTTSSDSSEDEDEEVIVTTVTPPSTSGTTYSQSTSWDDMRMIAWLAAAIVIAFSVLIFLLALLIAPPKRRRR